MDDSPVKHFLLKFDVTGVGSQTITNAKIRLYNTNAASEAGDFYHVTDDSWQEEIITWNNAPAAETTLLASLGSVNANTWYEVDVTAQITGDGTYSFRISDSVGGADYSSKEGANDPELVLTLGGTPVATNTPTLTPTTGPSPTPTNTSIATATFTPTPTQILPLFSNADFTYDGDGKRVKSVITTNVGTTTKYIVGTHYEVADGVVTKYYYAGKQRIAVRTNGTLNYLLGDHLASTSLITDANGQVIDQLLGNGLLQQSCYDANTLRLTKLRMYSGTLQTCGANPSSPRLNLSYTYQDNGNISQMVDSTRNETLNYTYDELNRLKTVNGPYSQNYNYNAIGNITDTGFQMAEISADRSHTCAETNTGGAKCWGNNTSGRLGDGTSIDRTAPVSVSGLATGVSAISSGGAHTCALMIGGGAKCWGKNANGQLGDGTTTQRTTPVDVSGLTSGVSTVSAGADHTCALTTSGGVKCWGDNLYGQLGDGTNIDRNTPVNVSGLTSGVSAVVSGENHTCAVLATGGLKCWGRNNYGQLGDNSIIDRNTPVDVSGLTSGVSAVSAGEFHTCTLSTTGGLKCWGRNTQGQLGDGTTTQRLTPVDVSGLTSGVSTVSAGADHTCARTTSGGAKCWGDNIDGQLGDGTNTDRLTPTNVSGLTSGVGAVSSGGDHSCALTTTGGVKCWGGNPFGQLGDGTLVNTNAPVNTLFTPLTTYTYGNTAHKHAVTSLATGESYNYDANGNMITRVEGGLTYTQTFDAENRLISVTVSGQTTQFVYDGDGNLVKKVKPDGSKTLYVGGIYEVDKNSGGTVTGTKTYYPAAGAMRIGSTLYYVLKDHLGSASIVTNSTGTIIGEDRFYPFGETRFTTGAMYTDKLFTGQREMAGLGIYHYGARFYSPKLGRFLSPDTIVPGYTNPQNLNRFSYVTNNPLRYTDPTGHMMVDGPGDKIGCSNSRYCQNGQPRPPIVNAPSLNRPNRPNNSTVTTSTPSVTNVPPPALPPVPSVTPPPLPTISSLGTPSNTPSPFVSSPQIVTTQTPTPPLGWSPSGDPEWFQYIDGQDMFLDGAGLVLDLVIPGVGGRPANAVQVIGTSLDLTDAAFGAIQTVQDTSTGSADWYTYASFATDIAGLGVPIVPDAVGIVFNVYHAHQLANQYP